MGIIKDLRNAIQFYKYFNTEGQQFTPSARNTAKLIQWLKDETNQIDTKTVDGQVKAYLSCPPVSTIISKKSQAFSRGDFWFGNADGKQRTAEGQRIWELLNNPNEFQNRRQFMTMAYTMNQLFGKCYIYGQGVSFGSKYPLLTADKLYVIPNPNIEPIDQNISKDKFGIVKEYRVEFNDSAYRIPENEIFIWNDETVSMSLEDMYATGQSRLYPLSNPVTANAAAYNANNALLTNYGAMGVLMGGTDAAGSVPFLPNEQKEIQDKFSLQYGILKDKWQIVMSQKNLQYIELSRPINELGLKDTIEDTTRAISEAYNYPMRLLGFANASTYNNVTEAGRALYENAIIPEAEGFCNFINSECGIENKDYQIRVSYESVGALQTTEREKTDNKKAYAELLSILLKDGVITTEEYRAKINIEEL